MSLLPGPPTPTVRLRTSSADRLRVGPRRPWSSRSPPTECGPRQVLIDVGADLQDDGELPGPSKLDLWTL